MLAGAWRTAPPPPLFDARALSAVTPLLLATGAAALAWWRVRQTPLGALPVAEPLHQAYLFNAVRDAVLEQQLAQAVRALASAGFEPLLAKGWAVARLYPEPALRTYGDIDLYLPPEQHASARAALMAAKLPPMPVDLHPGFSDLDDRPAPELRARSRTMSAGGVEVRVLGPEDHLRLLCLHLLRHGASRPLWLGDVGAALESRPDGFDWDYFLAGDRWRAHAATRALGLAQRLLDARLEGTPAAQSAESLPSWLVSATLRQWGSGSGWRNPMASSLGRPTKMLEELRRHWPNAIEGTAGMRAPFNALPRLPFQIAFALVRAVRFAAARVPRPGPAAPRQP